MEKQEHVYSHDYNNGLKLMEHSWIGNHFVAAVETLIAKGGKWFGDRIVWAGDYADNEPDTITEENKDGENLFGMCEAKVNPTVPKAENGYRFLVNLDTNEFVDKDKVPKCSADWNDGEQIHPLPLLTCEGNGRGGGDFHGESDLVGKWARNRIVAQNDDPIGCTELIFDIIES
jgi:hypothetical protein